ncbi:MAG: cupin domain-containing protein [Clostridia bacterium]|nr:cupin domain-containing protein [Clostridia bacterium]
MVRRPDEMSVEEKCIRGGNGNTVMKKILTGADEMNGKGRMFNLMTLAPGRSIGKHTHEGDSEVFYFLSGSGKYCDNGNDVRVGPGDAALCRDGECHSLENDTDSDLVFIAVILYS